MTFESSFASRRRVSTRSKKKLTERVKHTEDAEKSKKKYESRTHILENKMQEWDELLDDDLWDLFRTEFAEWIDENFKLTSIIIQKKLKTFLRSRDVWIMKSSKLIIAKSFAQVVKKDTFTSLGWPQGWVSDMSDSPTRSNPRVGQKFLSDGSGRVLAIVRRSNPTREIVRNLRLDKIR
jgi:hypothetical protein